MFGEADSDRSELFSGRQERSAGGMGGGGFGANPQQERLHSMQQQATRTAEDTTDTLKRALAVSEETRQIGIDTMETLNEQGEQLNRINDNVDKIHSNMNKSERLLRGMGSLFGAAKNWFSKPKTEKTFQEKKYGSKGPAYANAQGSYSNPPRSHGGGYIDQSSSSSQQYSKSQRREIMSTADGDYKDKLQAHREEQDDALDQISDVLGDLKTMGMSMQSEISRQNDQLSDIHENVESADMRLKSNNRKINRMLH